jgi:DNA (cytosine-5)-methyltransferase 1
MNELALFAGAGGGILGGLLCGFRTVCAVEHDAYARDVLVARQNDGCLHPFPIWDDVCTFDGKPWRGRVDVVSGGFPCQDISAAGKGVGISGERSGLWREMARIIGEILPRLVIVENSPMLVGRGLGLVIGDLAEMGYDAQWGVVGAHHARAPHKRDRIWIVANASSGRCSGPRGGKNQLSRRTEAVCASENMADTELIGQSAASHGKINGQAKNARQANLTGGGSEISNSNGVDDDDGRYGASALCGEQGREPSELSGSEMGHATGERMEKRESQRCHDGEEQPTTSGAGWWVAEPDVGRVANGVAARVERLRCIGNGQVPAVVRLAWNLLSE